MHGSFVIAFKHLKSQGGGLCFQYSSSLGDKADGKGQQGKARLLGQVSQAVEVAEVEDPSARVGEPTDDTLANISFSPFTGRMDQKMH